MAIVAVRCRRRRGAGAWVRFPIPMGFSATTCGRCRAPTSARCRAFPR